MSKQLVIKELQNEANPKTFPKLHLVKGGVQYDIAAETKNSNEVSEHVDDSHPKEVTPSYSEMSKSEKSPDHLKAIEDVNLFNVGLITATELKKRYSTTYKNWDDMKQRCRGNPQEGKPPIERDPTFDNFADFLHLSGPRPHPAWSVDRIDPTGPYSPDNCRWASKKAQSRNRTNTVYLTYQGITLPLVEWAEKLQINPAILRRRKFLGYSDTEIIGGQPASKHPKPTTQSSVNHGAHFAYTPWPREHREKMESYYQKYHSPGEHRLVFMERYSKYRMNALSSDIENVSWPEDYDPGIEEVGACVHIAREYDSWQAIFWDAKNGLSAENRGKLYRETSLPAWAENKLKAYA